MNNDPAISIPGCTAAMPLDQGTPTKAAIDYFNRGRAYHVKGLRDQAIADYTRAIELKPDDAAACNNRGAAYTGKGLQDQATQALSDAEKAVALNPQDAHAFETRAEIFERLGQRDKADADYRTALQIAPDMKSALDGLKRLGVAP